MEDEQITGWILSQQLPVPKELKNFKTCSWQPALTPSSQKTVDISLVEYIKKDLKHFFYLT